MGCPCCFHVACKDDEDEYVDCDTTGYADAVLEVGEEGAYYLFEFTFYLVVGDLPASTSDSDRIKITVKASTENCPESEIETTVTGDYTWNSTSDYDCQLSVQGSWSTLSATTIPAFFNNDDTCDCTHSGSFRKDDCVDGNGGTGGLSVNADCVFTGACCCTWINAWAGAYFWGTVDLGFETCSDKAPCYASWPCTSEAGCASIS